MAKLPRLLITMGDVAGIGPEIIARAWPELVRHASPVVVGDAAWLRRALASIASPTRVIDIDALQGAAPTPEVIPCLPGSRVSLSEVVPGKISAAAGQTAFDFLVRAI